MACTAWVALAVVARLLMAAPGLAQDDPAVFLKNQEERAVSVPLGKRDGLTPESDLQIVGPEGEILALIYPEEIHDDLLWSQALSQEVFDRIREGMPVRMVTLGTAEHERLREEGTRQALALAERRRERLRHLLEGLRAQRGRLRERFAVQERRVAQAELDMIAAEGLFHDTSLREEKDIDRSIGKIQEYADEREELQSQRESLAAQEPFPEQTNARLTTEIRKLSDRIEDERRGIIRSKDRSRTARSRYLDRRLEWRELVAERDALRREIDLLEGRIEDLAGRI